MLERQGSLWKFQEYSMLRCAIVYDYIQSDGMKEIFRANESWNGQDQIDSTEIRQRCSRRESII